MVASGLAERTEVSQYRLATHLVLACVIFAASLWTAQRLRQAPTVPVSAPGRAMAFVLVGLVLLQIYFGALLAGLRGGLVYNTWPLIDGALVPPAADLFRLEPLWRNLFENTLTVQFAHRLTAYTVWAVAVWHAIDLGRTSRFGPAFRSALVLAVAISLQAGLGVLTLLHQVPAGLALLHQGMAIVALGLAVAHAERLTVARAAATIGVTPLPSASSA
jgi:cytochrome c oxidase assembly protein subunit 15